MTSSPLPDLTLEQSHSHAQDTLQVVYEPNQVAEAIRACIHDEPSLRHEQSTVPFEDAAGRTHFRICSCGWISVPHRYGRDADGDCCDVLMAEVGRRVRARAYGDRVAARIER